MRRPARYLLRMLIFLAVVCFGVFLIRHELVRVFSANPFLNGPILGILIMGIIFIFAQTIRLWPEVNWIKTYSNGGDISRKSPRLLAPLAQMIGERRGRLRLTPGVMRSLLEGLATRLDESREISRYIVGALVLVGLLGTFWGLLVTIESVTKVIGTLSIAGGEDFSKVFAQFKKGLVDSLGGAGTAFSTSLFGLAGSLVLGFLDLQAGQAQNRFYTDTEDWMSGMTRLSAMPTDSEDMSPEEMVPAYLQALLEHTAEVMEDMQQTLKRGEDSRAQTTANLAALTERLGVLAEQMRVEQNLLSRLAEGQVAMQPILGKLAEGQSVAARLVDHQIEMKPVLSRMADEQALNRQEMAVGLRGDIQVLTKLLSEQRQDLAPVVERSGAQHATAVRDMAAANNDALVRLAAEHAAGRQELIRELRNEFKILARTLATFAEGTRDAPRPVAFDRKPTQRLDD